MPHGPEIRSRVDGAIDSRSDAELGGDYDGCITAIGDQLNAVAGLDGDEAVCFSGRDQGPKFVMQQAGGNRALMARTTSASRAWRRSADWLRLMPNASITKERLSAC